MLALIAPLSWRHAAYTSGRWEKALVRFGTWPKTSRSVSYIRVSSPEASPSGTVSMNVMAAVSHACFACALDDRQAPAQRGPAGGRVLLHGDPRRHDRRHRGAADERVAGRPAELDRARHDRLSADTRRAHPAQWLDDRSLRAAEGVPLGHRDLHPRLAGMRAEHDAHRARGAAHRPGRRRGDDGPRRADRRPRAGREEPD